MINKTRKSSKKYIPESTGKPCDYKGCKCEGIYKAPKDRSLKNFYWFCLKHVQEYNKNWNFYAGMDANQIEEQLRLDMVGHRPTWKVNDLYANAMKDPLDILGLSRGRQKKSQKTFEDDFSSKDNQIKRPLLSTVEHLEAIKTLKMTPPITTDTVKNQYKALAKKYHPDKNAGSKEAEEMFKTVTQAYHLLIKALNMSDN
ncbi:MAG: molecular chaperone DnaJ [Alphaproteobacteria bacterium]|nr:molecular chaperone DnaJ [Alphaproteobacteria bacterium]